MNVSHGCEHPSTHEDWRRGIFCKQCMDCGAVLATAMLSADHRREVQWTAPGFVVPTTPRPMLRLVK